MLLAFIWAYFCYPEIRGRTLAEIDEMFEAGVSARAFEGYVCVNNLQHTATVMVKQDGQHVDIVGGEQEEEKFTVLQSQRAV